MNPVDDFPLRGRRVLVTRPEVQSLTLCNLVNSAGGEAILLPAIEIRQKPVSVRDIQFLKSLGDGDCVIFISRNAVRFIDQVDSNPGRLFGNLNVLAVGTGTREALYEKGITNVNCPEEGAGSEALLELDLLKRESVQGTNTVIMRGEGGRDLIQKTLRDRGANVVIIDLYQRTKPDIDTDTVKSIWRNTPPDVMVITSGEGLLNLIEMTPAAERQCLFDTPLVVISDRIRDLAISSGFRHLPRVAVKTDDAGLLQALIETSEDS